MNILLLNGSPRHDGNSMTLARMVTGYLAAEIVQLDLYDLRIASCRGCGSCLSDRVCVLDDADDMASVVDGLRRSDIVLLVSPLHFTSLSGPLVCCIGRLQRFWKSGGLGGHARRGGVVLTGGGFYKDMFEPARRVALAAFSTLGIEYRGLAVASGTDDLPVAKNADAVAGAEVLAQALSFH